MLFSKKCEELAKKDIDCFFGQIDFSFLDNAEIETLYFLMPGIEALTVAILSETYEFDIEINKQGRKRTLKPIIDSNNLKGVFGKRTTYLLSKYYNENGLRNSVMHFQYKESKVSKCEIIKIRRLFLKMYKNYVNRAKIIKDAKPYKIELV